jgi:hypothetical protein
MIHLQLEVPRFQFEIQIIALGDVPRRSGQEIYHRLWALENLGTPLPGGLTGIHILKSEPELEINNRLRPRYLPNSLMIEVAPMLLEMHHYTFHVTGIIYRHFAISRIAASIPKLET